MKNLTLEQIKNLKKGDCIINDRSPEMTYRYEGFNNGDIWEFSGIVYENDEDMDGHFDYNKNPISLTKSELMCHYCLVESW